MSEEAAIVLTVMTFVAGAVVLIVATMTNRRHLREMAHRERLAMIERGLVPPPEKDPGKFEAATGLQRPRPSGQGDRYRTAGVVMIGIGLGLFMLIAGVGGVPDVALGVGGAWVMLGGALLVNYFLMRRDPPAASRLQPPSYAPLPAEQEPPSNIAP